MCVGLEVLNDALRDKHESSDYADRQQHVETASREIDPEITNCFGLAPRDAANEGDRQHDARSGGCEVVKGKTGHLNKVTHRRFAGISLPVCVAREARCSVKREVGLDSRELLRVKRQVVLNALKQVKQKQRDNAEHQHRCGVGRPVLFDVGIDSAQAINQSLNGAKQSR